MYTNNGNSLLKTIDAAGGETTYSFAYGNFDLSSSISVGSRTLATYTYTCDNPQDPQCYEKHLKMLAYGNGDSVQYTYDDYGRVTAETFEDGNILSEKCYDYTTGALGTVRGTVGYTYDGDWGDLLKSYGGQAIDSDDLGNMTSGRI